MLHLHFRFCVLYWMNIFFFNSTIVQYSYFPHVLSLHILYVQLQTVKYINCINNNNNKFNSQRRTLFFRNTSDMWFFTLACAIHYLLTYWLTDWLTLSMNKSPSLESNYFSAIQDILRILCTPKVHCHIYKFPLHVSILSHMSPVHAPSIFLKIHINIINSFMPWSSKCSPSLRSSHQNPECNSPLLHTCYERNPSYYSRLDYQKILGEDFKS